MKRIALALLVTFVAWAATCTMASAAGLLIADGGLGGQLEITEHNVRVTINNGIAVTEVTQVFHNTENRQVEALYTFPVPRGASVADFSMWINGTEMVGEVVEAERAREIYNSYKRVRRDPGLLEQVDYKTFELRIFPIAPNADQKIRVTYYQELDIDHDWVTYVYPLATTTREGVANAAVGTFSMNIDAKSAIAIAEFSSPSHGDEFVIANHTDEYAQASLEIVDSDLRRDVVIAYHTVRPHTGMDLVTSNIDGEDGYFYLSLTAGKDLEAVQESMDYVFVLDISGSMAREGKMKLSRNSLMSFIDGLDEEDRFEVMTFNIQSNALFGDMRKADAEAMGSAAAFLNNQKARGGTMLQPAIEQAYQYGDPDRQLNVVILSDGMTELQERKILLQTIQQRPSHARVFCIGVGNEINKPLLEQMAQETGGLAAFLSKGDDFERQAAAFRRKLTRPVATDLNLSFEGIEVYDITPATLPNLYHGAPLRIFGRYRKSGNAAMTLQGEIMGSPLEQNFTLPFPKRDDSNPEIERMWAWHRIDELLKQADARGSRADVVDEIVRLGEGYSIVSEYTSFLVLENDREYKRWKIERKNAVRLQRDHDAQAKLRQELLAMRNKTQASNANAVDAMQIPMQKMQTVSTPGMDPMVTQTPSVQTRRPQSRNFNVLPRTRGGGGGAIDGFTLMWMLLAGTAFWFLRRR